MSKLTSDSAPNPLPYPKVPEGKSLLMDQRTAEALASSIAHWGVLTETFTDSGPNQCALCRIFHPYYGDPDVLEWSMGACHGCPIRVTSGRSGCAQTPYDQHEAASWKRSAPGAKAAAKDELDFLKHIQANCVIRDYAPTGAKLIDTPPEPAAWPTPPALDLISKISSGPNPPTCWPPATKSGLYLHLYHGRETLVEDMDDWGFEGPHIGPLVGGVSMTYGLEINIVLEPEDYQKFFGALSPHFGRQDDAVHHSLRIKEGCVAYNGMYYNNFNIYWR